MTARIAIVGASVRAAAAMAVRAGFEVVAADLFADEDLCAIAAATRIEKYPRDFAEWMRELQPRPDAWLYTGALENHPELIDEMAAIAPLWGNASDVLRKVRSPWRLAEVLAEERLLFPETRACPDGLPRDGSWLVKSGHGGSGSGVSRYVGQDVRSGFLQEFKSGIPASATFVAHQGRAQLVGVARQLIGESWLHVREFQFSGAIAPSSYSETVLASIRQIGTTIAREFGLRGAFGVDLIVDEEAVWTIEANPRIPASMELFELATGVNSFAAHASAWQNVEVSAVNLTASSTIWGKAILFAQRNVNVTESLHLVFANESAPSCAPWSALADVPRVGTRIAVGQPVVTAFASAARADEVAAKLQDAVAVVESRLYPQ